MKAYIFTTEIWRQIVEYLNKTHSHTCYYWRELNADVTPKVLDIIRNHSICLEADGSKSAIELKRISDIDGALTKASLYIPIHNLHDYDYITYCLSHPLNRNYALVQSREGSANWVLIGSPYKSNMVTITLPPPPQLPYVEDVAHLTISAAPLCEGIIINETLAKDKE